jgi:hypothetical protein
VDVGPTLDGGDHGHADVGEVLDDLHALVVDLAPHVGVGHVAEGGEVDGGHEVLRPRQDDDLVRAVLADAVEGFGELGVVLGGEGEGSARAVVDGHEEHALAVALHAQAAGGGEVGGGVSGGGGRGGVHLGFSFERALRPVR